MTRLEFLGEEKTGFLRKLPERYGAWPYHWRFGRFGLLGRKSHSIRENLIFKSNYTAEKQEKIEYIIETKHTCNYMEVLSLPSNEEMTFSILINAIHTVKEENIDNNKIDLFLIRNMIYNNDEKYTKIDAIVIPKSDPLFLSSMDENFIEWEKRRRPRGSRNRLKRYKDKLAINYTTVSVISAGSIAEIDRVLAAFHAQRARMAAIGRIPNPFSDPRWQALLREASINSLGGQEGFRLHALEAGGNIVATHGALFSGDYMSGYMTSMDEDFARYSPGKILQREVLRIAHEEGVRAFDLGLGDDAYKAEWAERVDLYDVLVPLTMKGHIVALVISLRQRLLYGLKRSALGRRTLKRLRFALDRYSHIAL